MSSNKSLHVSYKITTLLWKLLYVSKSINYSFSPSHPWVSPGWPYCQQAQCRRWFTVKHRPQVILKTQSPICLDYRTRNRNQLVLKCNSSYSLSLAFPYWWQFAWTYCRTSVNPIGTRVSHPDSKIYLHLWVSTFFLKNLPVWSCIALHWWATSCGGKLRRSLLSMWPTLPSLMHSGTSRRDFFNIIARRLPGTQKGQLYQQIDIINYPNYIFCMH